MLPPRACWNSMVLTPSGKGNLSSALLVLTSSGEYRKLAVSLQDHIYLWCFCLREYIALLSSKYLIQDH